MASGVITGTTGNKNIKSRIRWSSTPDNSANTSTVVAFLEYRRTDEGFRTSGTGSFSITIDGVKNTTSKTITITETDWVTAISYETTVNHNSDGTKSIKLIGNGYISGLSSLTDTNCSGTVTLDTIPRASTITSALSVTLGDKCTVRWRPLSKSFWYKIKFSVGEWSLTTTAIHPNITTLYTNASYIIPLDAAHQFPNSKDAEMTVTLYTYSDEACKNQIGTASTKKCRVYIPENEDTLPTVKMSLSPEHTLSEEFNGLYIQGKTKVQASFTGSEAKYSATIKSYSLNVNGKLQTDPNLSELLSVSGSIPVKGVVSDSRGLSESDTQEITVIPYSKPSIVPYSGESSIICKRCDEYGNITPSGTYLRLKAGRLYSKVIADSVQKNFCLMQIKYKHEGATSWSSWSTILAKNNESDSVDVKLTGINLSVSTTYLVHIEVVDDVGESSSMIITIPMEDVTVHLRDGGKAVGIGKYAEQDNIVDIDDEWKVNARGDMAVGGTFYPSHIASIDVYSYKDFNELVYKTGYYTGTSAPSSVSCKNYPIDEIGLLEVISAMTQNKDTLAWGGFAYQTYRTHTGEVYMRSYHSSEVWTDWKQISFT